MEFDPARTFDLFNFEDMYEQHSILGEGAYGRVVHCTNRVTNLECAVKIISKASAVDLSAVATEVHILSSLSHAHVVEFRGVHQNEKTIFIEMELLRGGSLTSRLKRHVLSEEEASTVMRGVLSAVSYMHRHAVLHRDLKPDNILFGDDNPASVKVTDFGLSARFGQQSNAGFEETCGTVCFMAPEQTASRYYSKPVDIWSCAIILYMIVTGKHPLLTPNDTVQSYIRRLEDPRWKFPQAMNPQVRQLFLHMTNSDPLDRYTADQALGHPWISRTSVEIPKTYCERVTEYNARSRLKLIVSVFVAIGTLLYKVRGKAAVFEICPIPHAKANDSPATCSPADSPGGVTSKGTFRRSSTDCTTDTGVSKGSLYHKSSRSPQRRSSVVSMTSKKHAASTFRLTLRK